MTRTPTAVAVLFAVAAVAPAAERVDVAKLVKQNDAYFRSAEGRRTLDYVVSWQNPDGGWMKAYDASRPRPATLPSGWHDFGGGAAWLTSTIDNNATYGEMRALARATRVTQNPAYAAAFRRGLSFLLSMQYANGGFPQRFPLQDNYSRHVTFNDDAMTNVLRLLNDVAAATPGGDFAFVEPAERAKAKTAFEKGVACVLACQVVQNGRPTVWCQQHDATTLAPAGARAFELPSLCSTESATVTLLLMEIDQPSPAIKAAVNGAAAWFEATKIVGKKWETVHGPEFEGGQDRRLVDDASAGPLWARFYDLDTGRPFFVGRDGVKRWNPSDIDHERRVGYAWYSTSPQKVLAAYHAWKKRIDNTP